MIIKINRVPFGIVTHNKVKVYRPYTIAFYKKFVEWLES
jgi:hypothetical protein